MNNEVAKDLVVLILVVVDDSLVLRSMVKLQDSSLCVLILVVVDDSLVRSRHVRCLVSLHRLNPCCSGR